MKDFNTKDVTSKFFTQGTSETQETHSTQETPETHKQPLRKYRYNLNLDKDLDGFLHKIAWEKRTSMTQYLNDLIRREKQSYLDAGGSLDGWEKEEDAE